MSFGSSTIRRLDFVDVRGMVSDQSGFGERNLTRFHLSVLLFDIFIALTIGIVPALCVFIAYVGGLFTPTFLGLFHKELEDYIKSVIWRPKEKKKEETKGEPHHMGKDEKLSTQIHGEEPFHPMQPWAGLKLPVEVDNALQELLSLVLSQYIYNWYSDLSDDKAFVHELQVGFRHVLANLYRRARKVDVCKLILEKLIPTGMMHLDCYLHGRSCSEQERNVEQATLDYYGSHLHVALKHGNERKYLQALSKEVSQYLLSSAELKALKPLCCEILSETILFPSLNALADPDVVNSLLVLLFSPSVPDPPESMNQPWVNFLENFVSKYADAIPPPLTLKDVRNNPTFLQYFWDFLKDEKANNLMQFLLDVEELNQRLLNPDLDAKGQQQLHVEAKSLFHTYFVPGGDDYICFASEVQKEIQSIVEGPTEGVEALRRGNSLFKAYEHVYNLLEGVYCPLFQHSNVSFSLKWGPRLCDPAAKNISKSASRKGVRVGRRIDRLKGVVLPQPSEGQAFDLYSEVDFSEEVIIPDDDISLEDELPDSITTRDLSAWRVSVPSVDERLDFSHKSFFVYIIDVRRIDIKDGESEEEMRWQVERRYEEFYVLEAKLTEFHGEFSDLRLPPKSTLFGSRGLELMKSRRAVLEEYLQKLLQKPNLRGSELIFSFLTSQYPFTSSFLPDLNLGRMFRSVPIRLRKERGQNLEPFLASFIASTEPPKPKPSKLDMGEMIYEESGETRGELRAKGSVGRTSEESRSLYPMSLNGIYDIIVFLGVRVFAFSSWLLQILLFLRSFVHEAFNAWAERLLRKKLEESLTPHKISLVIHFIRDTVFFEGSQSRTDIEKLARSGDALRGMREIFPPWLKKQIGIDHLDSGTKLIFSVLQHPRLNKQLSYVLLDILSVELFPEIKMDESKS